MRFKTLSKAIILMLTCVVLTGCSLIPRITFDSPGTTPQETEKSKRKIKCSGDILLNEDNTVHSCSKGFYEYTENFEKKERKFTIKERIVNMFRNMAGMSFWIVVAIIILCPSLIGMFLGGIFNGANTALTQTISAIKKFRRQSKEKEELDNFLRAEQDGNAKKLIAKKRAEIK